MKKVTIIEHITYLDLKFDLELEYYYDEELELPCVDVELGNLHLKLIKDKYEELKNQLSG